jgi:hypothetical protein
LLEEEDPPADCGGVVLVVVERKERRRDCVLIGSYLIMLMGSVVRARVKV